MQTLLVVEDDAVMHEALSGLLRLEGYEVVCVRSLGEALRLLEACLVDGALVDFWLGDDSCEPLISELVTRGIPTILISGDPRARTLADGLAIPHVHKPFVVDQLIGIISGTIARRSLRRTVISRVS